MMTEEKPWWWPVLTDEAWCNEMRQEFSEEIEEDDDDETIRGDYANGMKYANTWDHTGDAAEEHEKLADAFLKLVERYNLSPKDFENDDE